MSAIVPLAQEYAQRVESVEQRLRLVPEARTTRRPALGQWSAKEILGHLIDSAAHNHRRFVEAQFKDDLIFPGYDQEAWVAAQAYQHAPWTNLLALWKSYNLHLGHVVASMPEAVLTQPRAKHTLDRIALYRVSQDTPVTLEYLVRDYYRHLEEHVEQLLSACGL
jgi:hypothetical protein